MPPIRIRLSDLWPSTNHLELFLKLVFYLPNAQRRRTATINSVQHIELTGLTIENMMTIW